MIKDLNVTNQSQLFFIFSSQILEKSNDKNVVMMILFYWHVML